MKLLPHCIFIMKTLKIMVILHEMLWFEVVYTFLLAAVLIRNDQESRNETMLLEVTLPLEQKSLSNS